MVALHPTLLLPARWQPTAQLTPGLPMRALAATAAILMRTVEWAWAQLARTPTRMVRRVAPPLSVTGVAFFLPPGFEFPRLLLLP